MTPPMKVFSFDDEQWFMATSLGEAVEMRRDFTGLSKADARKEAHELTPEELRKEKMYVDENRKQLRTMATVLKQKIAAGEKPGVFCEVD